MSLGLHSTGCSSPATIFFTVGPGELSWIIWTTIWCPADVFTADLLKASVTRPSHSAFVSFVTIVMPTLFGGRGVGPAGVEAGGAPHCERSSATTTTAKPTYRDPLIVLLLLHCPFLLRPA